MAALVKNVSHQFTQAASIKIDYSTLPATGVFTRVFDLPAGAVPIGGAMHVTTAFNPGTSLTAAFGIVGTTGKHLAATTVAAAARTAFIAQNVVNASLEQVGVTFTLVGAVPTAGVLYAWLDYIVPVKQHETVG